MSVFVTGAKRRATLAIVRSLGKKGIKVHVGGERHGETAFMSKYCHERFLYPSPQTNPTAYLGAVRDYIRDNNIDVFFPVHDFELIPVLRNRARFDAITKLPFPTYEQFLKTLDKTETLKIAEKVGVPYPKSAYIQDLSELNSLPDLKYPLVLKPKSQTRAGSKFTTSYITEKNYVHTKSQLLPAARLLLAKSDGLIIQEYIEGHGEGVACLYDHGEERASFSYRRLREYPITGGPSTLRVSTSNPELIKHANLLLGELHWHGVAMVEFKVGKTTALMEINGRFWGSLALCYYAGMDFPYYLYRMALDQPYTVNKRYKVGLQTRWTLPGDLLHFYEHLKKHRDPSYLRNLLSLSGAQHDYYTADDPLPMVGALGTSLSYLLEFLCGRRTISGEYSE